METVEKRCKPLICLPFGVWKNCGRTGRTSTSLWRKSPSPLYSPSPVGIPPSMGCIRCIFFAQNRRAEGQTGRMCTGTFWAYPQTHSLWITCLWKGGIRQNPHFPPFPKWFCTGCPHAGDFGAAGAAACIAVHSGRWLRPFLSWRRWVAFPPNL